MDVVNKLWNFCHILRHDGVDYGDYIEQLTYLLFLKMADERNITIPKNCSWDTLIDLKSEELLNHYSGILEILKSQEGILGDIFCQPIPRIQNPVNLKKLINLIDDEDWSSMGVDVQGAAFEGLLERAASEGKKGAGQYFTPRPLIDAIVEVLQPNPLESEEFTVSDVACGTAGFLTSAYEWHQKKNAKKRLTKAQKERIKKETYFGRELVVRPRRLALMNLFLRGLEPQITLGDTIYSAKPDASISCILTNPPFGTKGTSAAPNRDDFPIKTSNKQLNFLQHIASVLKDSGRAGVVLPDSCLSEDKATTVWKELMEYCNVHTILKLPRGTFTPYAAGVKACVIFFQKGLPTKKTWIYDARTNLQNVTKRARPLTDAHFEDFVKCYGKKPNGTSKRIENERFKSFTIDEIKTNNYQLDFRWMKMETDNELSHLTTPREVIEYALEEVMAMANGLKELLEITK